MSTLGINATHSYYNSAIVVPTSIPAGNYYVTAFIDCDSQVTEGNEGNNIGSSSSSRITITATPQPPSKATSPSPASGATGQSINSDLAWANGGGATSYDVYFGTDSSPDPGELLGNQTGTSYDLGTLSYSTTYYWKIDAKNSAGTTAGTVWSFTTGSAATTRIIGLSGDLAFGSVTVGQSLTRALTISNTGNSLLAVSSINYPSGFSGNWSGGTIEGNGGSLNMAVTFSPTAAQDYGGTITVNSDKTGGTDTRACSGTGDNPSYADRSNLPHFSDNQSLKFSANDSWFWAMIWDYTHGWRESATSGYVINDCTLNYTITNYLEVHVGYFYDWMAGRYTEAQALRNVRL